MPIQTNCEIRANRPDIVIKNKQEKSYLLINMSIPTEKNTSVKVIGNRSKYKDLEVKIERNEGYESHNNTGSDRSPETNKERIGRIYTTNTG